MKISPIKPEPKRSRGGQIGNQNPAKEIKASAVLHMRCLPTDKGAWTKAANRAVQAGLIQPDARGNLASWVALTLNQAADRQLGQTLAIQRQRAALLTHAA